MMTFGEALQLLGLIVASWLVLWWGLRPLSFVYRLTPGRLSVRSFFVLPVADVRLSEVLGTTDTAPTTDKPLRKLVSLHRHFARQSVFAETEREWLELPDWLHEAMTRRSLEDECGGGIGSHLRGDAGYQHLLAMLMALNRAGLKLASWCAVLSPAAAWCLILLPLYLTAIDVIGSNIFAREISIPVSLVLGSHTWTHFAASAFLVVCGIMARVLIELRKPLPWPLACIILFAAVSRFFVTFPGGHDVLSHTLFDSCTGYYSCHAWVAYGSLAAAVILVMAAWSQHATRPQVSEAPDPADAPR